MVDSAKKTFLFLLYVYASAIFCSMAGLTLFGNLMLLVCIVFSVTAVAEGRFKLLASQKFLLALVPWGFFTLWINGEMSALPDELGTFNRMVIGVLAIYPLGWFIKSENFKKHMGRLFVVFLLFICLAHISGIIGLFHGFNPVKFEPRADPTRAAGLYGMAITYGYGCQFLLLTLIGLFTHHDKFKELVSKKLLVVGIVTTAAGFALALARGAIIGFACGLPFIFRRLSPVIFKRAVVGFASIVAVGFMVMLVVPETNRLSIKSDSNKIRISQYEAAYHGVQEKWLFGHGFRQFSDQVGRIKKEHDIDYKKFVGNSHNIFVEALVATGIPGLLLFFLFCYHGIREAWNLEHYLGPTIVSCWVAFLVSGLFQTTFVDAENMYFFFAIYALSSYLKLEEEAARHKVSV